MDNTKINIHFKNLFMLGILTFSLSASQLFAQANKPRVNNEKPEKGNQVKRMHPHGLKLILQGKKEEAIAYLERTSETGVNPEHTKMLLDIAHGKQIRGGMMPRVGRWNVHCLILP